MSEPWDADLRSAGEQAPGPPGSRRGWSLGWSIGVGLLLVAVGLVIYFAFGNQAGSSPTPAAATQDAGGPATPIQPLGGEAALVDVPPLDESDPFVRDLIARLSSHPRVTAWLATDGLIRNFTVVVSNVAEGATPANHLRRLSLSSPFRVTERGEDLYIDPRSYDRYTGFAEAVASIDPAGSARLYATLKPRIEEAHRELGEQEPFDRTLERAIVMLLRTPVVEGPAAVAEKGIGYGFADPRLEALRPVQKQLLRAGPANVRTIQGRLYEIALALGIPPERLPGMQ